MLLRELKTGRVAPYRQYELSLLEPAYLKRSRRLEDLAVELVTKSSWLTFTKQLFPQLWTEG